MTESAHATETTQTTSSGGVSEHRIRVEEDIVATSAEKIQQNIVESLKTAPAEVPVVLDLTHINFVDSMGFKIILGLYKTCCDQTRDFSIESSSEQISKLLKICQLNKIIQLREVS